MPVLLLIGISFLAGIAGVLLIKEPSRRYPKGHIHEYDPTGKYTYAHQNPLKV